MFYENNFKVILPEIFILTSLCFLLIYGVIYSNFENKTTLNYTVEFLKNNKIKKTLLLNSIVFLAIFILIIVLFLIQNNPITFLIGFNNTFIFNDFSNIIKVFVIFSTLSVLILLLGYNKTNKYYFYEYVILILLALLGIILIISTNDLITMYLTIEMQSLALYVLAASKKNSEYSSEAGLKYFILGAISSGFLLFGSSLIYGFTGTVNFEFLSKLFSGFPLGSDTTPPLNLINLGVNFGLIFLISGLLFKLAAAPFHMWSPDVYEGSPSIITIFFVITTKIAIFSLLIKLLILVFYDFIEIWQQFVIFSSICSLLIGAFAALPQKRLKRLLAYSSITHVGFMLMGFSTGTIEGLQSLFLYVLGYMIMSLTTWSILLSLEINLTKDKNNRLNYLSDLSMLHLNNPILALTFSLVLFSLAGVPPLFGFFSKLYVICAAIDSFMYNFALIGLLTSVLGAFYYLKLIKIMYFEKIDRFYFYKKIDKEKSIIISTSSLVILFFFIYPNPFFLLTHKLALFAVCII